MRFLSRGRAFTDAENQALGDLPPVSGADYERGVRPARGGDTHTLSQKQLMRVRYLARRAIKPFRLQTALSSEA